MVKTQLTPEQKAAKLKSLDKIKAERAKLLANETPDQRAKRIVVERAARLGKIKELANKRIPIAVKRISLIGNLAAYKPTPEQSLAMVSALQDAVNNVRMRLNAEKQAESSFTLPV